MRIPMHALVMAALVPLPALAQVGPADAPPAPPVAPPAAPPAPAPAAAPAPSTAPTISGFIDASYNYNVNRPANGVNGAFSYNNQHNNLALNAAHLALNGDAGGGLTYTVEIDVGNDATLNHSNNSPQPQPTNPYLNLFDIQEAYATYKVGKLGFKFGKFVTYNGIELIESPSNPTISRGYLYGFAEPITHVGALALFQATDQLDIAVGVVNGWDLVADNNGAKTIVYKAGFNPSPTLALTLSGTLGPEQANTPLQPNADENWRETVDLTGMAKVSMVDLWFQGNYGRESKVLMNGGDAQWFGFGVQPLIHLSDELTLGLRAEFFKDNDGARTGTVQQLFNFSAAPAYAFTKHFQMRLEGRVDISDQAIFIGNSGLTDTKKNQVVFLTEGIATF